MARFGKKKKFTEYLYSKPSIFILLIICVLLATAVYARFTIERSMSLRKVEAEKERQILIDRKMELEERVEYLSGERGIEEEIRKHFDVAKEGEQVVIIVDNEEKATVSTPIEEVKKPWYQFWE